MYYIVSDDGKILETCEKMSDNIIQEFANDFCCTVYAIRGEHSGYTARPEEDELQTAEVEQ